jgi:hypothetical protein
MPVTFTVPITLISRGVTGRDGDGNDVYGETVTVVQGVYAPADGNGTGGNENTDARDTVIEGAAVYLPAPAPTAVDAIRIFGLDFEIEGTPQDWSLQPHPFTGWVPSLPVIVRVRRVTG